MADEGTLTVSLSIRTVDSDGNVRLEYRNTPSSFNFDVSDSIGPCPGAFLVTTAGVSVDLSDLTTPGPGMIYNLGDTNTFDIGIWDPDNSKFLPLFQCAPHQFYPFYVSANLEQEYGSGTGTTGAAVNRMRLKAVGGNTYARVDVFEA